MYDNYEVINGYVKILKNKKEFKNCEFYYIGIQEKNREEKEKDVNKNITEGILKIKLFLAFDKFYIVLFYICYYISMNNLLYLLLSF